MFLLVCLIHFINLNNYLSICGTRLTCRRSRCGNPCNNLWRTWDNTSGPSGTSFHPTRSSIQSEIDNHLYNDRLHVYAHGMHGKSTFIKRLQHGNHGLSNTLIFSKYTRTVLGISLNTVTHHIWYRSVYTSV